MNDLGLTPVNDTADGNALPGGGGGVPTAEALAGSLRHLANRRSRSGRVTSTETVRAYASALPTAFAGIRHLGELAGAGADRVRANIRSAWGSRAPATLNAPPSPPPWPTSRTGAGSPTPRRCWMGSAASTSPSLPMSGSGPVRRPTS